MDKEIELEKMKSVALVYLSKELWEECIALNEPVIQLIMDSCSEEIILKLTCKTPAHHEGEYDFIWYKSWWQELRVKILPRWWIERHSSLKEIKKTVRCVTMYPSIKIGDVNHKGIIKFI